MSPIIIFRDHRQAVNCLRMWQGILNLQSWIIGINLQYGKPVIAPNWGSSSNWRAIRVAEINIPMPRLGQINPFPQKYSQELIVVHELMHIIWPGIDIEINTTEGDFYEKETHANLESIAKAFIIARYGVSKEWFYNS